MVKYCKNAYADNIPVWYNPNATISFSGLLFLILLLSGKTYIQQSILNYYCPLKPEYNNLSSMYHTFYMRFSQRAAGGGVQNLSPVSSGVWGRKDEHDAKVRGMEIVSR